MSAANRRATSSCFAATTARREACSWPIRLPNPFSPTHQYAASIDRVLCAILLGILTYDAKLLIIEPRKERKRRADPDRRQ